MANIYGALWVSGFKALSELFGLGEDEKKVGFTRIKSTNLVFKLHTVVTVGFLFLASGLLQISKVFFIGCMYPNRETDTAPNFSSPGAQSFAEIRAFPRASRSRRPNTAGPVPRLSSPGAKLGRMTCTKV